MCLVYTYICVKNFNCLKMWFHLRWYNVIRWSSHICKKSYFLSFYSFLVKFSEYYRGNDRANWQSVTKLNGVKYAIICKWHTFWMAPCLICYFIVYWEKVSSNENLATILSLKSKLSGKFNCFNAIDVSIKMLKNSWISKNSD